MNTVAGGRPLEATPTVVAAPWFRWIQESLETGRTHAVPLHLGSTVLSVMKRICFERTAVVDETWVRAYASAFPDEASVSRGMRDRAIPPAFAIGSFRSLWPNAPMIELADAGHFVREPAGRQAVDVPDATGQRSRTTEATERGEGAEMDGEYEPSPWQWVREQVETYERTGGRDANTLRDTGLPIVVVTMRGRKTGKIRKVALMRVEHEGEYALVASMGGAPKHPIWYLNLVADPSAVAMKRATSHGA